jgi:hypothetical protein
MKLKTEDGQEVKIGDRVYNYYDMKPGVIEGPVREMPDPWFDVKHDDGTVSILNGQRICSMEYAVRRGFPGAEL